MSNNFKELTNAEAQELNGGAIFDRLKGTHKRRGTGTQRRRNF